jgi:hypothetical protein
MATVLHEEIPRQAETRARSVAETSRSLVRAIEAAEVAGNEVAVRRLGGALDRLARARNDAVKSRLLCRPEFVELHERAHGAPSNAARIEILALAEAIAQTEARAVNSLPATEVLASLPRTEPYRR